MVGLLYILKEHKYLVLILLLGTILRFYHIDFQSAWLDEIHTINESNPNVPWSELYQILLVSEPHPPLYFILVKFVFSIFGYSTLVVRLLSAVIGIVSIYALYLLANKLFNKKVGLIAALLLAVNYFHISYSQEARMYVLFCLFTILSFYKLIFYLKTPTFRNAILFGIFSSLMIYSHFFALFTITAQYCIILYFVLHYDENKRKQLFINSVIIGLLTIICYLPVTPLIIASVGRTSLWIPPPTADVFTLIFKEFFNNSELLVTIVYILIVYYFIDLFKQKSSKVFGENKTIFAFVILFLWLLISILIPLIRSHVSLPIIVSRYFINVLPVIIMVIASAIYLIKNKNYRIIVLSTFILLSVIDLVVIRKYYHVVRKTQFREITSHILEHKANDEKLVTSLRWYFPFFINNGHSDMVIVDKPLDQYIESVKNNDSKLEAFWYADAHIRPYSPSPATQLFIDNNYIVEQELNLFDCYTKRFVLKKDFDNSIDLDGFSHDKSALGDKINYSIENFSVKEGLIKLKGWAFLFDQSATTTKINIGVFKDGVEMRLPVTQLERVDVTDYFNNSYNLDHSGFESSFKLSKGNYKLFLMLEDSNLNKKGYVMTDKSFTIN